MIIAGWVIGLSASKGLQLPVTQTDIATAITTILFIILAYFDAKYPNNLIEKATPQTKIEVTTDELSNAIKEASEDNETKEDEVIGDDQQ